MKTLIRLAAVAVMAAAFAFNINAADSKPEKGGKVKVVPGENVVMRCGHCKEDYAVKVTPPTAKGTKPDKVVVGTHNCEKCGNKLVVKGSGKSKDLVTEHTCKGCDDHK